MSVATTGIVPEPVGGGPGTVPGDASWLRPRDPAASPEPARARRMDRRPLPRLRRLAEVLEEAGVAATPVEEPLGTHGGVEQVRDGVGPVRDGAAPARGAADPGAGPAWDAAMEAAVTQVGPLAVGLLTAVAEVLDGRRPFPHLARLCPPTLVERVQAGLARVGPGFPRGARVRGLRVCPIVGTPGPDGPGLAVEVAAALCGQARPRTGPGRDAPGPDGPRARAAVARYELDASRTWRVTELAVL